MHDFETHSIDEFNSDAATQHFVWQIETLSRSEKKKINFVIFNSNYILQQY